MQSFSCPNCGAPIDAPASGERVLRCAFCKRTFDVGILSATPPVMQLKQPTGVSPMLIIVGGVAAAVAVGAVALLLVAKPAPAPPHDPTPLPPQTVPDVPTITPEATATPMPVEAAATAPDLETSPVTLTWKAHLTASSGSAPPAGSPCNLSVTVTSKPSGEPNQDQLTLQCQGQMLYDSKAPLNGMSNWSFGLDETPVAGLVGVYRYQMRAGDTGPRSAPRAQISLNTDKHVVEAFRDEAPSFRVRASVDASTAERRGRAITADSVPPFAEVVERKAKVTSKSGSVPFGATSCDLKVSPGYSKGHNCRVTLVCGGQTAYGAGTQGFDDCSMVDGHPLTFVDAYPTPSDGDPEINCNLEAGTATLGDTSKAGVTYSVTFALSAP